MDVGTRMTVEPRAHGRRVTSLIVVYHPVLARLRQDVGFDRMQELEELRAAIPCLLRQIG